MTAPTQVPKEIAHLDFDPATQSDDEFSLLKECMARLRGTKDQCPKPAVWQCTFRCCGTKFYCCALHRRHGDRNGWWCRKCLKSRSPEWMGWKKL